MCATNANYIFNQINSVEMIYIDTCSLMNVSRLNNFITNSKNIFIQCNKKIIVHDCVMTELAKFSCSMNEDKRFQALSALEIIRINSNLFEIDSNADTEDNDECFADPKLLSILLKNRRNYKQLLISNDRGLTYDAFNFNHIESFNGNRINVCYLNSFGDMHMCDCAKRTNEEQPKEIIKTVERVKMVKEEKTFFDKYGKPALYFTGGFCFCAGIKPLGKLITKMI